MRTAAFAFAAVAIVGASAQQTTANLPQVTAAAGTLGLGQTCSSSEQCASGVSCYGTTASTIKRCGAFNAPCQNDNQCSTNTCSSGSCSGFLAESLYRTGGASSASSAASSAVSATTALPSPNLPQVSANPGTLQLGATCSETVQCAGGATCYGTTAFTIKRCGAFNAPCSSDAQCSTNTCQNGGCSGFLAESLYKTPGASSTAAASTSSSATGGIQAAPSSTVVAAAGSLQLGAECASTEQCAGGAECFASTAWQIKSCGKFNAKCTSDAQCSTNTCNNGICSGFLASSLYKLPTTASATGTGASTLVSSTVSATGGRNGTASVTGSAGAPTSSTAVFTGDAVKSGLGAAVGVVAVAFAWMI